MADLPKSVQEIADVIGAERAMHLIQNLPSYIHGKPGKRCRRLMLYVPKRITMDSPLVAILGFDDAAKMVKHFGGEYLKPANCSGNKGGRPKKNPAHEIEDCKPQNPDMIHHGVFDMLFPMHGGVRA